MKLLQELLALREAPQDDAQQDPNTPPAEDKAKEEEQPAKTQNAQEQLVKLFQDADEANKLSTYVRQDTFDIKPAEAGEEVRVNWPGEVSKQTKAEEGQYIVRKSEEVNKLKLIDEDDFKDKYELVNPNEKADAEGFTTYRIKSEVIAFPYEEKEVLDLNIAGHFIKIHPGDYVGHPTDNAKKLIVMSKVDFEKKYRLS